MPFCPYHFVQCHFVHIPFCPYHFVRTVLSATILYGHLISFANLRLSILLQCRPTEISVPLSWSLTITVYQVIYVMNIAAMRCKVFCLSRPWTTCQALLLRWPMTLLSRKNIWIIYACSHLPTPRVIYRCTRILCVVVSDGVKRLLEVSLKLFPFIIIGLLRVTG